jgi:hypothetical protein
MLGSVNDPQHLPLSTSASEAILQRLQERYSTRSIRSAMHRTFRFANDDDVFEMIDTTTC